MEISSGFTKPAKIGGAEKLKAVREKSFKIPEDVTGEQLEYVIGLRFDAPFEYTCMGGMNFEKAVYPSDFSLRQNEGKVFRPRHQVCLLTKTQAEAIALEAAHREITIPITKNPKYDEKNNDEEKEYLPSYITTLGEWLILEQKETFNDAKYETPKQQTVQKPTTPAELKAEMLDQQRKKGK